MQQKPGLILYMRFLYAKPFSFKFQQNLRDSSDSYGKLLRQGGKMEGMELPKSYSAVILGKRLSSVYRELDRNSSGCVYTRNEAQKARVQRCLDNKPSPKLDDPALTREIMRLFKHDLSADQISGRLAALCPEQPASTSTIHACLYGERPRCERAFQARAGETAQAEGGRRPRRPDT
jgi:IS30 family transposase